MLLLHSVNRALSDKVSSVHSVDSSFVIEEIVLNVVLVTVFGYLFYLLFDELLMMLFGRYQPV